MKKYYSIKISRKGFWAIWVPVLLLTALISVFSGYYIVNSVVMPKFTDLSNRELVKVPKVIGLQYEGSNSARQLCFNAGLKTSIQESEYNDTVPAGVVLLQDPKQGEKVKRGRVLTVILSSGGEVAAVPLVAGSAPGAARHELTTAGFTDVTITRVYDSKIKKDIVVGTEPAAGLKTSRELPMTVLVSRGKKPATVRVPDLAGRYLSEARHALKSSGLEVGDITYQNQGVPGTVVSQSRKASGRAPYNSRVDLVISAL